MFESLSDKLQDVFKRLRGKGSLTEADVSEALRQVRLALLEADVNFRVVKEFVARVKERAVGKDVLESLTPAQMVIKIVNEELTAVLGGEEARIEFAPRPPTIIMIVGLQGGGKTTHCAKLANLLRKQGRRPLLAACDIYRPGAIKQLQIVGEQVQTPVFTLGDKQDPVGIARAAVQHAAENGHDVLIVDTAGRLHIDEQMMEEVERIQAAIQPHEVLLVLDAMTGQDAVNVATEFTGRLAVTGFILTKLDGDTRGGAAISIRAVAGQPIKFVGVGEKPDAIEPFHPDRMASRILGMGDVLTLIEKAEAVIDEKRAMELEKKLRTNRFDLEDYLEQIQQMQKMGPLEQILNSIPGFSALQAKQKVEIDEKQFNRVQAIIQSMTREERHEPSIINGSRRRRIAAGSGTTVQEVNRLLNQFAQMRKALAGIAEMERSGKRPRGFQLPFVR
jgi:signal recognition particle subunit SRP54